MSVLVFADLVSRQGKPPEFSAAGQSDGRGRCVRINWCRRMPKKIEQWPLQQRRVHTGTPRKPQQRAPKAAPKQPAVAYSTKTHSPSANPANIAPFCSARGQFAPPWLYVVKPRCALFDGIMTFFRQRRRPSALGLLPRPGAVRTARKTLLDRIEKKPRARGAGPKSPREENSVKGEQRSYLRWLCQWLQIYHTRTENLTW